MENGTEHPARGLLVRERVDYMVVVAAVAAADGTVVAAEMGALRDKCKELGLDASEIGEVIAAAEQPDAVRVEEIATRLRGSSLRFTLVTDLIFMAYADGQFAASEWQDIVAIAAVLDINEGQVTALVKYAQAVREAASAEGVGKKDFKKLGGDVAATLASAGVPIAAVAAAGVVPGLSAAGVTSGLAALGLGLGMTAGIGVVAGIGVGSYFGVRWLYRKVVGA